MGGAQSVVEESHCNTCGMAVEIWSANNLTQDASIGHVSLEEQNDILIPWGWAHGTGLLGICITGKRALLLGCML